MTGEPAQILVVDDDDASRYVKARQLLKSGYGVAEAAGGQAAIEAVTARVPDLIMLDVNLPDMSGIEVCRRIKAVHPGIVVLQTSAAYTDPADRTRSLDGGADSYLVEPIEPAELEATVRALLRMRTAERKLRHLNDHLETLVLERTHELADVNRRLEAEIADRHQAEEMLWHTQRLEVIGRLAGGVAHDFNNLLAVISGNQELIRDALERPGPIHRERLLRYLGTADRATVRGAQITGQLLAFSRRSTLRHEVVEISGLISGFDSFLRRALGEAVSLDFKFAPALWSCRIDPVQFEAAILNLIVNARDAMIDGGLASIELDNVVIGRDGGSGTGPDRLEPGDYVRVRVADSGVGMSEDVKARAFEPFFTTKEVGSGSGLGLSQVYGFVKQSGGHITIDSVPGRGTAFSLYLPRATSAAQPEMTAPPAPDELIPTGSETVLVVEDNEDVRNVVVTTISDLGYRVLTAANGAQALELIDSDAEIDLLFSDVVMPGGISGFDLVREAMGRRHRLRAVFTSGYARESGAERADYPLIMKPYRRAELAQKIRLALDGADGRA